MAVGVKFWFVNRLECCVDEDKGGEGWPRDVLVKVPLPYYRHANVVRHLGSVAGTMLDSAWSGKVLHNWLNHRCMRMKSYANFRVQIAIWRLARMCEVNHLFPEVWALIF